MASIVLATLNARYAHAALGLRYLLANMGELRGDTELIEFVLGARATDVVETLLARRPRIIGLGVYIWNVEETSKIVAQLKAVAPQVIVVLGGPEVSYECEQQSIVALADYTITGWGDVSFAALCRQLVAGEPPSAKVIAGVQAELSALALPYAEYTAEDLARRHIYVEASRGCPFKCEFCLSALDKTAWPFDLERLLAQLDVLYRDGARDFRFVDRTFNLKPTTSRRILEFFLERVGSGLFVHFELIPDHLPQSLRELIAKFPPGVLQLEIGIQSFDPAVQARISRRQDNDAAEANLRWLRQASHAHLHVDLIAGLPGEDLTSFAAGFDRLVALAPHEIQVGILKRLRGTPIARHTSAYGMRFNPVPPYNILANDQIDFTTMQRLARFARYWDLYFNSGRFSRGIQRLLAGAPFTNFLQFSDWLFSRLGKTHEIAHERLFDGLGEFLVAVRELDRDEVSAAVAADFSGAGGRGRVNFLAGREYTRDAAGSVPRPAGAGRSARQARHARVN
jgi:radical SAM superfamily enzyme YgiQ (UPF0313 family)